MKRYLKHSKIDVIADSTVDWRSVSLSEPVTGKRSKPSAESVELGDILPEIEPSDPEKIKEREETRVEKERLLEEELRDVDAKLQTMLLYYKERKEIIPELRDLIDTLYSVYVNENKDEAEEFEFEAKYSKGAPVKELFDSYFFNNIDSILSSYDNLKHGIYTLKVDYPTQLSRLQHGI
jgi:hypothetical protein